MTPLPGSQGAADWDAGEVPLLGAGGSAGPSGAPCGLRGAEAGLVTDAARDGAMLVRLRWQRRQTTVRQLTCVRQVQPSQRRSPAKELSQESFYPVTPTQRHFKESAILQRQPQPCSKQVASTWLDDSRRGAARWRRPPNLARPHAVAGVEELDGACARRPTGVTSESIDAEG